MTWTPHPYFKVPSKEQALAMVARGDSGVRELQKIFVKRELAIINAAKDPFKHGVVLDQWKDAEQLLEARNRLLVSGGNRSGKTQFAARYLVRTMVKKDRARVAAFSMTAASSVRDQQPAIFNYLPNDWKRCKKTRFVDVTYSAKNGFAENTFILPNGSQCFFFHYSQQEDIMEGAEFDLIWFDELVPHSWIKTGEYRLITRKGKMLITVTPILGWTPVVNDFIAGATVTKSLPASLLDQTKVHVKGCPAGHMPYVAECLRKDSAVILFHTERNPFQSKSEIARVLKGETPAHQKIRAYGWTEKSLSGYFGKFNSHHIIPAENVPATGTNYMVCDPAGSRMWFALWMRVTPDGTHYIYREFPDLATYGEWAELGEKAEGEIGEAARPQGWGIGDFKRTFLELEGKEKIFERMIDPRAGGTPHQTQDGSETLIDMLANEPHALDFTPASGVHIDTGVNAINDLLAYNVDEPISIVNTPRLFISEACGNLIRSLQNVTAAGGDKNKWKDPVDCLRYLIVHGCTYVDESKIICTKGGSY